MSTDWLVPSLKVIVSPAFCTPLRDNDPGFRPRAHIFGCLQRPYRRDHQRTSSARCKDKGDGCQMLSNDSAAAQTVCVITRAAVNRVFASEYYIDLAGSRARSTTVVADVAELAAAPGGGSCAGKAAASGSSSSFMPALKVLMPLAKSPITRGSFPAPNRRTIMARTTTQCIKLNEPIANQSRTVTEARQAILGARSLTWRESGLRTGVEPLARAAVRRHRVSVGVDPLRGWP